MDLSSPTILFAQVVEGGGFSAAARTAGHAPSAVGRQIALPEDGLGVRLLICTQTGVSLTEAGAAFHARRAEVAALVAEAESAVAGLGAAPSCLVARGTPRTPDDSARRNCLRLSSVARWNGWGLTWADGQPAPIGGSFEANDADAIYRATLASFGVARLSS